LCVWQFISMPTPNGIGKSVSCSSLHCICTWLKDTLTARSLISKDPPRRTLRVGPPSKDSPLAAALDAVCQRLTWISHTPKSSRSCQFRRQSQRRTENASLPERERERERGWYVEWKREADVKGRVLGLSVNLAWNMLPQKQMLVMEILLRFVKIAWLFLYPDMLRYCENVI